jgi:hypothetical protein
MNVEPNSIDSEALGKTAIDLRDFGVSEDFDAFEAAYLREFRPFYCACKVPLDEIESVHCLESKGFRFIETQIRLFAAPRQRDVAAFPYEFTQVSSEAELEEVTRIAESTYTDDRFSIDPEIAALGTGISGKRYRLYIEKSFREPDERVYKLSSKQDGRILGFNTHKYLSPTEVLMFNGGVLPEYKTTGLGAISDYLLINELKSKGVRKFVTHVSARNYPIMNLEISGLGFKVERSFAVLRKIYV